MDGSKLSITAKLKKKTAASIAVGFFICARAAGAVTPRQGLDITAGEAYGSRGANTPPANIPTDIPTMVGRAIGALLAFIGVLFLVLMIYGGFIWMTARGNEQEVTRAKELITAAVIGLVIVLAAYTITSYVGSVLITG